jgi:hypothetical protein
VQGSKKSITEASLHPGHRIVSNEKRIAGLESDQMSRFRDIPALAFCPISGILFVWDSKCLGEFTHPGDFEWPGGDSGAEL